jgi:hypothetical protein
VRSRPAAIGLGGDHRLDACSGDLFADGVGIVAAIGEEGFDPVIDHPEERRKALHVMRLAGRPQEAEREPRGIASGVELGGEAPS